MSKLELAGCAPEPLLSYMKGLGVLRVVSEQADGAARAAWSNDTLFLESKLERDALLHFFLDEYCPTPVAAPWGGGSGFFAKDNKLAVEAIAQSQTGRLEAYRATIVQVREILSLLGIRDKPSNEVKDQLLRRYRRELPDAFVAWMDSAIALQTEGQAFAPILGTGGNDGRLDFTQNFMQRVVDLGFPGGKLTEDARHLLQQALFAEAVSGLSTSAVGQFDPGRAGGPNASQGLTGSALVNPWNFILAIEGALLFSGAISRRLGSGARARATFPFTVRNAAVGYGSKAGEDESSGRRETWLPLWTGAASLRELRLVFAEGRAEINGRASRDGVDFARAVATLGIDRGIRSFVRYAFLKRSGKAYVATPLGRFGVAERRGADLLSELDSWLDSFRRACHEDNCPARFRSALHRIDASLFNFCRFGGQLTDVVRALGGAERELSIAPRFRQTDKRTIQPIAGLRAAWLKASDDGSREFRLARSLAFLRDCDSSYSIRLNLEPVEARGPLGYKWAEGPGSVAWSGNGFCRNVAAVLDRRLVDYARSEAQQLPLLSSYSAALGDIGAFLRSETDDEKTADLLWGLMLIRPGVGDMAVSEKVDDLPRSYAMLKLLFLPVALDWGGVTTSIKPEPAILSVLRRGDLATACRMAGRRLWANGLVALPGPNAGGYRRDPEFVLPTAQLSRLPAALLFPIEPVANLAEIALRPPQPQGD